jgi:hypothetical protein
VQRGKHLFDTPPHQANAPGDMNIPGWKLHPLESDLAGHWSVWVSGKMMPCWSTIRIIIEERKDDENA